MDQEVYETRYRAVKLAKKKVKDVKKRFTATDVTSIHVKDYRSRLKEISDKLDDLDDVVGELIVDLDEENAEDKVKIDNLETLQAELLDEVKLNEREVEEKVKSLMEAQPLTKAEQQDGGDAEGVEGAGGGHGGCIWSYTQDRSICSYPLPQCTSQINMLISCLIKVHQ